MTHTVDIIGHSGNGSRLLIRDSPLLNRQKHSAPHLTADHDLRTKGHEAARYSFSTIRILETSGFLVFLSLINHGRR
jgi:hypothetical protein